MQFFFQVKIWFQNRRNKWKRKLLTNLQFRNMEDMHYSPSTAPFTPRSSSAVPQPASPLGVPSLYREEQFQRSPLYAQHWSPLRHAYSFDYNTAHAWWNTTHYGLYHPPPFSPSMTEKTNEPNHSRNFFM